MMSLRFLLVCLLHIICTSAFANYQDLVSYLNKNKITALEFYQEDAFGHTAKGVLLIEKPYKFRLNYYEPNPILIVGNKNYFSVYDFKMKHLSRVEAERNTLSALLLDDVDLRKNFQVISEQITPTQYQIKLFDALTNKAVEIIFDHKKNLLKNLIIYEDNNQIKLDFVRVAYPDKMPRNWFILQDPDIFGPPKRLTAQDVFGKSQ